ncbi:hypothetical protein IWQ55_001164 [Labrenzia sp. EL_208]|nr:hypothetical protein [Labrenzia sp. EL_132]MBG6227966.1 hypothetical protein [Labrenzia sp. EL_208]
MREDDRREIVCLWKNWDTRALGICALETAVPGMVWSVWYDGQPAAAYGFSQASTFDPDHWQAWAFGTDRFRRCVPLITRHLTRLRPLIEQDCRRLQVIAHCEHDIAHRWIESFGGQKEGLLRSYGRGGEDYFVYAWIRNIVAPCHASDREHSA